MAADVQAPTEAGTPKRAIIMMFDSLNRHMLSTYAADTHVAVPNFERLAAKAVTFDRFYAGSMPCMPARREMHTGRYNFLHRSWGPLEPFDDSMPEMLGKAGIHTHLISDHPHYWEDGGATFHTRYTTWEQFRGQEGDPWKAHVAESDPKLMWHARLASQDRVNRQYMTTEAEHVQTRTVDAGIEFLETNHEADRWMLQLELFDPHEPFFAADDYLHRYLERERDTGFDWPGYKKVTEAGDRVDEARRHYAALMSMCDHSLGRVLDFMDAHDMWNDTLLMVNTDHGFLLGEHGWWAKGVMPWFDELVHIPMFLWDPRTAGRDVRRGALAQTIDIAPTMLGFFGIEPTPDMQGRDLARVLDDDATIHEGGLFGVHGGHVNVTDGHHVYMRACADQSNAPLQEFTLMPTHMRGRFSPNELADWEPAEPFSFTKGLRTITVQAQAMMNPWNHGSLLFDTDADPGQLNPLVDDELELRMLRLLADLLHTADAPASQFERLGIPADGVPGPEHLLVRAQRDRATSVMVPLPRLAELPAGELLTMPLPDLMSLGGPAGVIREQLGWVDATELVNVRGPLTLYGLASVGVLPAPQLIAVADALTHLS